MGVHHSITFIHMHTRHQEMHHGVVEFPCAPIPPHIRDRLNPTLDFFLWIQLPQREVSNYLPDDSFRLSLTCIYFLGYTSQTYHGHSCVVVVPSPYTPRCCHLELPNHVKSFEIPNGSAKQSWGHLTGEPIRNYILTPCEFAAMPWQSLGATAPMNGVTL